METYTLIVVGDERAPMRRFQVPRARIRHAVIAAGAAFLLLVGVGVHYGFTLRENAELAGYRVEANSQREQIQTFEKTLSELQGEITRVREFERKVRIIANLPGAAATGGLHVTERAEPTHPGEVDELMPPAGVPVPARAASDEPSEPLSLNESGAAPSEGATPDSFALSGVEKLERMGSKAFDLDAGAKERSSALSELLDALEVKHTRLTSMPSVWPAKGWLTSRFGKRISPFTGRAQKHSGIDIAAEVGTPVVAPGDGRVSFVGRKGPLGQSVVLDHGFGVRTVYGHNSAIHVKIGDEVVRGQLIASVGSTGRSTGPHLHYTVEVKGETRDPLDYIFD